MAMAVRYTALFLAVSAVYSTAPVRHHSRAQPVEVNTKANQFPLLWTLPFLQRRPSSPGVSRRDILLQTYKHTNSWLTVPNNSAGHYRKATAVALGFISTNSGGIAVSPPVPSSLQDAILAHSRRRFPVYMALPGERRSRV